MSPATRQAQGRRERPMQAAYLAHIDDGHAWGQCCRDRARDADTEPVKQLRLTIVPLTLTVANAVVREIHRHHKPVTGHRFSLGVRDEAGVIRGVAIVGRPVARKTDQYTIAEVTRVATDGCPNACSALYGAARRVAREMGFARVQTFILESEDGTSLRAAGWILEKNPDGTPYVTPGRSWSVPSRHREDDHPTVPKHLYYVNFTSDRAAGGRP